MITSRVVEILKELPALAPWVGNRIYPMTWPDAPEYPLIIVQKAVGLGHSTNDGDAGIEETRVQVEVYSDSGYDDCIQIKRIVRRRLHASRQGPESAPCVINASFCINDSDQPVPNAEKAGPRLRCRMLEFKIWTTEA